MSRSPTDIPVSIPSTPSSADYAAEADRPLIPNVSEPFELLSTWLEEANAAEVNDSSAMSLATVDADGLPDVRIVLLRGFSPETGFQFYSNYDSQKGQQLAQSGRAALCFHWKSLRRQIRVRGEIARLSPKASDAYFNQRAPQSRIAAIASDQSRPLESREAFNNRVAEISSIYGNDDDIPRPAHWGGYALMPLQIEFWQDQAFRMHDRLLMVRTGEGWDTTRLYP